MPKTNLLRTLAELQQQDGPSSMLLTFQTHLTAHYRNGKIQKQWSKKQSCVHSKQSEKGLMLQLEVMGNSDFSISLQILIPRVRHYQKELLVTLPKPVDQGCLSIMPQKLGLSLQLYGLDKEPRFHVHHVYSGISSTLKTFVSVL